MAVSDRKQKRVCPDCQVVHKDVLANHEKAYRKKQDDIWKGTHS